MLPGQGAQFATLLELFATAVVGSGPGRIERRGWGLERTRTAQAPRSQDDTFGKPHRKHLGQQELPRHLVRVEVIIVCMSEQCNCGNDGELRGGELLMPVAAEMKREVPAGDYIQAEETPIGPRFRGPDDGSTGLGQSFRAALKRSVNATRTQREAGSP